MIGEDIKEMLVGVLKDRVHFDEPMSLHSTIRIGGNADAFAVPGDEDELKRVLNIVKDEKLNLFILGAGSNVLFRDAGFDGVVVSMFGFKGYEVAKNNGDSVTVEAKAGTAVSDLVDFSVGEGLAGFDVLAGIPGTIGGAISMNAGTHNGSASDALLNISAIDRSGKRFDWPKAKIEFSYRRAKFPRSCIVLSSNFLLKKVSQEELQKKVETIRDGRKKTQPLKWSSLGSIFKNPEKGPSAGQLIDEAGLKGVRVGGARISHEHGNWIVNENNATSKDIEVLIHLIKEKVKESAEVSLETEIVIVGEHEA